MSNNFIEEILGMKVQSNKPLITKIGKLSHFDTDHKMSHFEAEIEEPSQKPSKQNKSSQMIKVIKGASSSQCQESNEDFPNYEVDMIPKFLQKSDNVKNLDR